MLRNFLPNKIIKKSIFEVNLICFEPKKKKKKDIDFLFYYRIHSNKSNYYLLNLINKLADQKKNFYCWRLFLNNNVQNLGNIKRELLLKYLSRTKFSINSGENFIHCLLLIVYPIM